MTCKSILVVDDDHDIRDGIVQALLAEEYTVFEARNGKEALDILNQQNCAEGIGCIILDLMMPEMDGATFLNILRTKYPDTHAKIPVIVATAKGSPMNPAVIPNGVERLQKPMDLDDLYETIRRHCGEPVRVKK